MTDELAEAPHEEAPHDSRSFDTVVGSDVWYRLTEPDAQFINTTTARRNTHHAGQVLAGKIVASYRPGVASLQVFLDGEGTKWFASRGINVGGTWHEGTWRFRR
jgi:hypothetical protein